MHFGQLMGCKGLRELTDITTAHAKKSGIKIHTQVDIVTEIPVFYRITNANVHDVNAMDWLTYSSVHLSHTMKFSCFICHPATNLWESL